MGNLYMNMLIQSGEKALVDGNFKEAERISSIMLQGDISFAKAYKIKGLALQHMNRELDALVAYEDCLKYHPEDDELWSLLHKIKISISSDMFIKKLSNDERTKKYFKNDFSQGFTLSKGLKLLFDVKACRINSVDHKDYQMWRDITEVSLGCKIPEFKRGQKIAKEIDRLFTMRNNANIEKAIGNAFFHAKNYKYAIKKYEDATEHWNGTDVALYNNIAFCYFKLGEEDVNNFEISRTKSLKALVMGQQHGGDPKDISKAMARIGMCYESEKDVEKAIEWFEKSVDEYADKLLSMRISKLQKTLDIQNIQLRNPCMG